jgi:hypothetical protein
MNIVSNESIKQFETIHLTDLEFINLCQQKYGINRGIYNCIDLMFYNYGIKNILERRKFILEFLEYMKKKTNDRIKFGAKGLRKSVDEYLDFVAQK